MSPVRPVLGLPVDSTVLSADEATSALRASSAGMFVVTCADLER
ncbi:hypothetical protein AB0M12_13690 [Nocardia vinacea]